MMVKYIIRFDDLTRWSNPNVWCDLLDHCDDNKIRSLVALVPDCTDLKLKKDHSADVWSIAKDYRFHDYAMHGLNHEIFGGKPYSMQYKLMANSLKEFVSHNMVPNVFVPPKHIYDSNTLMALKQIGVDYISDGIGLYPWRDFSTDIVHVPQILWNPRKMPCGTITFCMHPDTMDEKMISHVKDFISDNKKNIISIQDVSLTPLEFFNVPFKIIYKFIYNRKFKS